MRYCSQISEGNSRKNQDKPTGKVMDKSDNIMNICATKPPIIHKYYTLDL